MVGRPLNFVLVLLDGLRADWADRLSAFPALARRAIYCPGMVTHAPYTIASMHTMLTGVEGTVTGVNGYYNSHKYRSADCRTLAEYLGGRGYHCQMDTFHDLIAPADGFHVTEFYDEEGTDISARHPDLLGKMAAGGKPFFLYLHCGDIHLRLKKQVFKPFGDFDPRFFEHRDRNQRRSADILPHVTGYLERFFRRAEDLGLLENTVFILQSDHGVSLGERPGEKSYGVYLYDYTVKVFNALLTPFRALQGRRIEAMTSTMDILPTVLDLAGIAPEPGLHRGISLLSQLERPQEDRILYLETGGVRGPNPSPHYPNIKGIRTGDWKFVFNASTWEQELYHLPSDPAEMRNIVGEHPELRARMLDLVQEHNLPKLKAA
jgi:arylsulfatase A-like enzyme